MSVAVETAKRSPKLKLLVAAVAVVAALGAARYFHAQEFLRAALAWIDGLGPWGVLLFIGLYVAACLLLLPGAILSLGAGVMFGVLKGTAIVWVAATLEASAAFLLGRYVARDWVVRKIEGSATFRTIDEAVAREGWKIVGLTRLSPVFPFSLLNYAYGLTSVTFRDYFFATWIGMLPGTAMYVYLGSLAGSLATVGQPGGGRTPLQWVLYIVGLAATVAVTVYVTRIARAALAKKV